MESYKPFHNNQRVLLYSIRKSTAVDQALSLAKDMAEQKRFPEALQELENVKSSIQVNKKQKREIVSLKHSIQTKGQRYILKLAKRLKNNGNHMKALQTIDMAKAIGMDDDLTKFFNKLKRNFDWRQIKTLEDTEYFVNCSFTELADFMKFPKRAGSNTYCSFIISFINEVNKDGYFGYLGNDIAYPVYVSIINPSQKGSTLSNKNLLCVFRINGTEEIIISPNNVSTTIPYLEAIFIQ